MQRTYLTQIPACDDTLHLSDALPKRPLWCSLNTGFRSNYCLFPGIGGQTDNRLVMFCCPAHTSCFQLTTKRLRHTRHPHFLTRY